MDNLSFEVIDEKKICKIIVRVIAICNTIDQLFLDYESNVMKSAKFL